MTAINAFARGERGYMLTDTALYDHDGVIQGFGNKTLAIPNLGMALASRGSYRIIAPLALEIGWRFASFDALIEAGPAFLEEFHDENYGTFAEGGDPEFDLVCVGYSEKGRRAEAYAISSLDHSHVENGAAPFTWNRQDVLFAPVPDTEELSRAGILQNSRIIGEPVDVLMRIVGMQRHMKLPCGSGSDHLAHIVGGKAILTEIRRDGVSQRVVRTWSGDRIGETITPHPVAAVVDVASGNEGLSRQQRRTLERARRKSKTEVA